MIYPRALLRSLRRDFEVYPVLAIMGARQVGKTTLCRDIADNRGLAYRTFDDADVLDWAQTDPGGFFDDIRDTGAVLDEIQRAPRMLLALKAQVDRDQRPGRYIITGSSQPEIANAVGDSLLGRAAYRTMRPLTLSELRLDEQHPGWSFLFDRDESNVLQELERRSTASGSLDWKDVVTTGGFPRVVAAPRDYRTKVLEDYLETFVRRDIREVTAIESIERFEAFVRLLAAFTGQVLNVNGISRDLGIAKSTIQRWLDSLRRTHLIEIIQPYSLNSGNRVIKAPKVFFVDSAFACAAARDSLPTGFHLENYVLSDMLVWRDSAPGRACYHWRDPNGQEVDFVLQENERLIAVEVKASSNVGHTAARHLKTFAERYPETTRGLLLSTSPTIRSMGSGVIAAPWWAVV